MGFAAFQHHRWIKAAADFLVAHQTDRGDFRPPGSRAGYNEIYDAKGMFTVLQAAFMVRRNQTLLARYLACVDRRLALFGRCQLPDGSLPLQCMGDRRSVFTTGVVAAVVKIFGELADPGPHRATAERCLDYMVGVFTPQNGFRDESNATKLSGHDVYPLYALHLWAEERTDASALVGPATEYVVDGQVWNEDERFWKAGFEVSKGVDLQTVPHPTLDLDMMWVLFETRGTRYADRIRSSIEGNRRYFKVIEAYYTENGIRYADVRARTSMAGIMALYDHHTGSKAYTNTAEFRTHLDWTAGMFDERSGGFRERENLITGEKAYLGVPAQYLSQYLFSCGVLNRDVPESVLDHYASVLSRK